MAYTIKLNKDAYDKLTQQVSVGEPPHTLYALDVLANALRRALSTFVTYKWTTAINDRMKTYTFELRDVRLLTPKPYCGNHAGPCVLARKLRTGRWLEGADWIKVHALVNGVLDDYSVACDVYTAGADVFTAPGIPKKRLIVRSVRLGARRRYDYKNDRPTARAFGRPHYVWNPGTADQFESGTGYESEEV